MLLYLMDMLHQPRLEHIKKDLEQSLKQCKLKMTTLTSDQSMFFSNYINKPNLVKFLVEKLQKNSLNVIQGPMDTDTTIIKTTQTTAKDSPINFFANDTDILPLPIHDMANNYTNVDNIYITNAKKEQQGRGFYNVTDVLKALGNHIIKYLLFAHALTVCDTSSTYNFGETSIFKKLKDSAALANSGDVFYEEFKRPEEIGNACIHLLEKMYLLSDRLPQTRKRKYDEMVRTDCAKINPSLLPLSPRAAYYHGLHMYHQIKVWKVLSETHLEPIQWRWKLKND